MRPRTLAMRLALATAGLCLVLCAHAADELLLEAKGLLDGGDAKAAYELLSPLQSERAGDPEYDYLLGVSALEIGRNTEAVFALERVLAVQPDSAPARAQIARAYFNLKETDTAKREFETVKGQEVPPSVSTTIDRYLEAIDRITEAERFSARFFLEFASGYDSNVNSATTNGDFVVPGLGTLRLTLASQEIGDWFLASSAGVNIANPLTERLTMIGGLSAYGRFNFTEDDFNTGYLDGYLGVSSKAGRSTFSLVAQGNIFMVADSTYNEAYRNAVGGTFQWIYDLNARSQFTAYVQYAALTYPDQSPRDVDRYIVGAGYAHAFRGNDPSVYIGIYGGTEQERDEAFAGLASDPIGLRLGGQKRLNDRTYLFANLAAEYRDYRGPFFPPFIDDEREDKQYSIALGVHYLLPKEWRVSPQVSYLRNDSNIEINEYDRWQAFVSLRRDW
jgi:tetratricopeptide (TPR) repeat protein